MMNACSRAELTIISKSGHDFSKTFSSVLLSTLNYAVIISH